MNLNNIKEPSIVTLSIFFVSISFLEFQNINIKKTYKIEKIHLKINYFENLIIDFIGVGENCIFFST